MSVTNSFMSSLNAVIDGSQCILDHHPSSNDRFQVTPTEPKQSDESISKNRIMSHRKQRKRKRIDITPSIINLHLSVLSSEPPMLIINPLIDGSEYNKRSPLIDPDKKSGLNLQWHSDFCLTEECESMLLQWTLQRFPYSHYGFSNSVGDDIRSHILSQQSMRPNATDTVLQSIKCHVSGRCILDFDIDLIAKTVNKFHFLAFSRWQLLCNKSLNMFFRDNEASKWWHSQLSDLRNLNASEWNRQCMKWKIMPSKLLKELLAQKKIFIDDVNTSKHVHQSIDAFFKYYDSRRDLQPDDYWKPMEELWPNYYRCGQEEDSKLKMALKAKKMKSFKRINQFLTEIGSIPSKCGGFQRFKSMENENGNGNGNNNEFKMKQDRVYRKWIDFAENIHRRKWMKYLKMRSNADIQNMNDGVWYRPFWTLSEFERDPIGYHQDDNDDDDDDDEKEGDDIDYKEYGIPNMDNLLTMEILEEMTKISLSDGVSGIHVHRMMHQNATRFEEFVFDAIGSVFGDRKDKDAVMMNEHDVRQSGSCEVSPDVLFSHSVNINGVDIYWMDMKHYYVTSREPITFKKIGPQIGAYLREFGNGAILCCGFQSNFVQKLKTTFPDLKGEILMLDCSSWYPIAKQHSS